MTKQNHRSSNGEPCFEAMRHLEAGRVAFDLHDFDKAIGEVTRAIRRCPNFARAYIGRAAAYSEKGDHGKAIADLTTAIGLSPTDDTLYLPDAPAAWLGGSLELGVGCRLSGDEEGRDGQNRQEQGGEGDAGRRTGHWNTPREARFPILTLPLRFL